MDVTTTIVVSVRVKVTATGTTADELITNGTYGAMSAIETALGHIAKSSADNWHQLRDGTVISVKGGNALVNRNVLDAAFQA